MNEIWVVSVKTSLPTVHYNEDPLKTDFYGYSSFEKARAALRKILKDYAFSENAMFDGKGNMIYMKQYIEESLDTDELGAGHLNLKIGKEMLGIFAQIFRGEDCVTNLKPDIYSNGFVIFELSEASIDCIGTGAGPINGSDPIIRTNMLSMQEEKEYYLYLDDLFGDDTQDASAELQIDLKKIQFIE